MINRLDPAWIARYDAGELEGKEDHRKRADLYLVDGHLVKALEMYRDEVGEEIPLSHLLEAAEYRQLEGDFRGSVHIYREAIGRISVDDLDEIIKISKGLKLVKKKGAYPPALITKLNDELIAKFR
jgi:hypothetical protein